MRPVLTTGPMLRTASASYPWDCRLMGHHPQRETSRRTAWMEANGRTGSAVDTEVSSRDVLTEELMLLRIGGL